MECRWDEVAVNNSLVLMSSTRSDEDVGPLSPLAVSLAAGFSGSLAAAASHGFDTAKSRSQCMVLPKVCCLTRDSIICI
ncbi:hypothetical protein T459_29521 [Capsicum annuum]|uniref:Uncharacterized protein n=1 Tax=Capsicum annuum TaxID=4072 RepID=A0A2G2Y5R1_CAPAN|nr:hypothetical protein T459_29521 [Capsicum annuum]